MMGQDALKKKSCQMQINLEKILSYPMNIFRNKMVLKTTIYSCLLLYLFLAFANIIYSIDKELFVEYNIIYNVIKDSIYQVLLLTSLGYFLSKYKFCHWTLLSFYGIFYLKIVWFIDRYVYSLPKFLIFVDNGITIITSIMILYHFFKKTNLKI